MKACAHTKRYNSMHEMIIMDQLNRWRFKLLYGLIRKYPNISLIFRDLLVNNQIFCSSDPLLALQQYNIIILDGNVRQCS